MKTKTLLTTILALGLAQLVAVICTMGPLVAEAMATGLSLILIPLFVWLAVRFVRTELFNRNAGPAR